MRTLITRCEALLGALRNEGTLASDLAEDAHRLAGGAGTFGFLHLAAAAREFEFAAETDLSDTAVVVNELAAAIDISMPIIRQELLAAGTVVSAA